MALLLTGLLYIAVVYLASIRLYSIIGGRRYLARRFGPLLEALEHFWARAAK